MLSIRWKNFKSKRHKLRSAYHKRLLREAIQDQHRSLKSLKTSLEEQEAELSSLTTWLRFHTIKFYATRPMLKKLNNDSQRYEQKYNKLLREHSILTGITNNSNNIITNLTGETLSSDEEHVLRFGLKHGLAT